MFRNTVFQAINKLNAYLFLLNIEVLAVVAEISVSNADRAWQARFAGPSRCAHAAMQQWRGTILMMENWFLNTVRSARATTANRRVTGRGCRLRQRIAAGRRHIAPALLLC
jgi:hypothetical protein